MALPALIGLGLSAYSAYKGAQQQGKANDIQNRATRLKEAEYEQLAPVRQRALDLAMAPNPTRIGLGSIFEDKGNPFNKAGSNVSALWNQQAPVQSYQSPRNPEADAARQQIAGLKGKVPGNLYQQALNQWQAQYPDYDATKGYTR